MQANKEYHRDADTIIATTNSSATFDFPLTNALSTVATSTRWGFTASWGAGNNCSDWTSDSNTIVSLGYGMDNVTTSAAIAHATNGNCQTNWGMFCVQQ
jgi:hypothetical protein